MHWNTHVYHDEYSNDHFDHYRLTWPDQPAPPTPDEHEGVGLWDAVLITLLFAAVISLILMVSVG